MRIYKPSYKSKDGETKKLKKFWLEVRDQYGNAQRFPGFTDKGQSELLGRQIERLVNYRVAGEQPDAKLSKWLEGIPAKMRNKFVKIGLLDASRAAAGKLLSEHLQDFISTLRAKGATPRCVKQVESRIRRILDGCKFTMWSDIQASKVQVFLAEQRNDGKGISAKTSNHYLQNVKQFAGWMVQDGRASKSPLSYLKNLNTRTDQRHQRRTLELDEARRLLETTKAGPERFGMSGGQRAMLYRLAIESGLRRREIKSLTVSSFDFEANAVVVEAAYSKHRRQDTVPLKPETAAAIKRFVGKKLPNTKIFPCIPNETAEMLRQDLAEAKIPYVDEAGRYLDFHSLRVTCASFLAASGAHPKVVQSIMRHSDINLTMSTYAHTLRGQESEAVASLPDLNQPSQEAQQEAKATGTDNEKLVAPLTGNSGLSQNPKNKTGQTKATGKAKNADSRPKGKKENGGNNVWHLI